MSILNQFRENYSIITLHGTKEIYIENFLSIIELSDVQIKIRAKGEIITVVGERLQVEYMNKDDVKINGAIYAVHLMEAGK